MLFTELNSAQAKIIAERMRTILLRCASSVVPCQRVPCQQQPAGSGVP
ncbi:hypothetical protein ACTMQO_20480 [Escherichia coli]